MIDGKSQQEGTRKRPHGKDQLDRASHPKSPDSRTGGSPGTRACDCATITVPQVWLTICDG